MCLLNFNEHYIIVIIDLAQYSPDRAIYLAERSISTIYTGSPTEFKPVMALDFFPRLLTNCTVR